MVIAIVGLYLTSFLFLTGNWSAASLAFVVTFALIVFAADRPRVWHYTLEDRTLIVEGATRVRPIYIEWNLDDFKAVTREQIIRKKGQAPYELLVLIGKRRLSWPRDVYLTSKAVTNKRILNRLTLVVSFDGSPIYRKGDGAIELLARLARLR